MNENQEVEIFEPEIITGSALQTAIHVETDLAISTAKKYPMHSSARDLERFEQKGILLSTMSEETAQACMYSLPRGKDPIEGRSVRFAEIVATAYGNIKSASRIIDVTETEVIAQGVCVDLENNVSYSSECHRSICYKNGKKYNPDMITVTSNAAAAIAVRNAILKAVPAALTEKIYQAAKDKAIGGVVSIEATRAKFMKTLSLMGIGEDRVLAALGRTCISSITREDTRTLVGLVNAIQNKEVLPEDAFPYVAEPQPETKEERLERIKRQARAQLNRANPRTEKEIESEMAPHEARAQREKENHEKALRGEDPTPPPKQGGSDMDTASEKEPTDKEWDDIQDDIEAKRKEEEKA